MAPLAADIGLPDQPASDWRYHADNEGFGPADGITLASVLRLWRPSRYVEIGSGWTSALALDVNDRFLDGAMKTTFIDPYPERLLGLLRPEDHDRAEIRVEPVQAVDLAVFDVLGPGDVLFIDSTHVARTGGDVVHDVFDDPAPPRLGGAGALPRHVLPVRVSRAPGCSRGGRGTSCT